MVAGCLRQPMCVPCCLTRSCSHAGCDVLWGGCPMVTLPLERMASRVAASLCYATGLGHEMVVSSQKEYEVGRPARHMPRAFAVG